jgi:hypothetical protein
MNSGLNSGAKLNFGYLKNLNSNLYNLNEIENDISCTIFFYFSLQL